MEDVFDDETEHTVTIDEYIEGLEAQELEADLVLGGDEGKDCTYSNGYMKRQAIFSCLTCVPDGNAGVCVACSLSCHDGHEVVELWTKRNFRCDCGNSKFGDFSCKLFSNKELENSNNSYNKNFKGSYCTCCRPYPDPDADEQVEMIQCCICEDWFHENHIGLGQTEEIPRDGDGETLYDEFVCQGCTANYPFMRFYALKAQMNPVKTSNEQNCQEYGSPENTGSDLGVMADHLKSEPKVFPDLAQCTAKSGLAETIDSKVTSLPSSDCILEFDINTIPTEVMGNKPLFFTYKWRDILCKCGNCQEFYKRKGLGFLIDKEDSLEEYEKIAKQKRTENLVRAEGVETNFFSALGHVQKIEILNGITDMKNELSSFLESFDSSKAVTAADVQGVFENLAKKKKQRLQ